MRSPTTGRRYRGPVGATAGRVDATARSQDGGAHETGARVPTLPGFGARLGHLLDLPHARRDHSAVARGGPGVRRVRGVPQARRALADLVALAVAGRLEGHRLRVRRRG